MIKQTVFPFAEKKSDYFWVAVFAVTSVVVIYAIKKRQENNQVSITDEKTK